MTVLDLTPPQPQLRLVSNNDVPNANQRDHRYRTAATLRGDARVLYQEVLQFALQQGISIDADALRVVLATKQATSALPARAFSAPAIWQLMFVDVLTWCRNRQLDVPSGCAAALNAVLFVLHTTERLDVDRSDSYEMLCDALDECTGGGWVDDSHPSSAGPSSSGTRRSLRSRRGPKRI